MYTDILKGAGNRAFILTPQWREDDKQPGDPAGVNGDTKTAAGFFFSSEGKEERSTYPQGATPPGCLRLERKPMPLASRSALLSPPTLDH